MPGIARELRAVWVATVNNIDWPSRKDLSTSAQKSELIAILDRAAKLSLNTVVFQVRPSCDAMYASTLEPWSEYLTGIAGKAPEPFYDPLAFAVAEAHKRGLLLHAWFNPYRARHAVAKSPLPPNHVSRLHPELSVSYGKYLWLDPGDPAVQDYSLAVIMDVVRRYDVDGVHLDDYFYPYKELDAQGNELPFPDDASWNRFGKPTKLSRDAWRRANVDHFIEALYRAVKAEKPKVLVGISPFGIWRPGFPESIKGFDAYDKLYADSRKWFAKGWMDYLVPQLYWSIHAPEQSFPVLLRWWSQQNSRKRHLLAGMDDTKVGNRWAVQEIVEQIRLTEEHGVADGQCHWSMKSLLHNSALDQALIKGPYTSPAIIPQSPWLGVIRVQEPSLIVVPAANTINVKWQAHGAQPVFQWLAQARSHGIWQSVLLPSPETSHVWAADSVDAVAVRAILRTGEMSAPAVLQLNRH